LEHAQKSPTWGGGTGNAIRLGNRLDFGTGLRETSDFGLLQSVTTEFRRAERGSAPHVLLRSEIQLAGFKRFDFQPGGDANRASEGPPL
jgi:hypothetical protein